MADKIYIWQERDEHGWGAIAAAVIPGMGISALQSRNLETATRMRHYAIQHVKATGNPLRLARYEFTAIEESHRANEFTEVK